MAHIFVIGALAGSIVVKIKKKHTAQKPDADGFWDAETPEQFSTRKQETEERVAGIEALLKEQAAKLLRSQQTAEASVSALAAVISEKKHCRAHAGGGGAQKGSCVRRNGESAR